MEKMLTFALPKRNGAKPARVYEEFDLWKKLKDKYNLK